MENPASDYVTYHAFGKIIARVLNRKKLDSETVRRFIWWAEDAGFKDSLDIKFIDKKPMISSSEENIAAYIELYREWKRTIRDRIKISLAERPRSSRTNFELENQLAYEDREISRYMRRRK